MRALCGAIITAGALIGLGLTAIGIGTRYSMDNPWKPVSDPNQAREPVLVKLHQMDGPLVFVLVFITCVAVIGLGVAFAGLAYHHVRRDRESAAHHGPRGTV